MPKHHTLISLLFLLNLSSLMAQQDFKIIGYLPYYRFGLSDQIDYSKLTHLNLAFANPDMAGNLSVNGYNIDPVVQAAQQHGVKVYISLAGGALTSEWDAAWTHHQQPENRAAFIHKIIEYVQAHGLDGVDMDLEWSYVTPLYSPFVLQLRDSLTAHGLPLTAALPGTYRYPNISDEAMLAFDFINMMVYDFTGPWAPNNPGQHSSYTFAVNAINYWKTQGMPADRLTLGVPFYGWNFNNAPASVTSATFGSLVAQNPANAQLDQVGQIFYNGIPTIRAKTELAMDEVAGIMIWELGQDAFNEYSLLTTIYNTVNGITNSETPLLAATIRAYPSPFSQNLYIDNEGQDACTIRLIDMNGRTLQQQVLDGLSSLTLDVQHLTSGFYFLQQQTGAGVRTLKLVKG
ncbi:MAG: T9SS type A sorting domain-containing protein [Saprospiraceae bacterium]|nr:T9SS type A sorting domain-containing protein [Saprospiraceae bacterium]